LYYNFEFCQLRFVSTKVCVVTVKAGHHVTLAHAKQLLQWIDSRRQRGLFIIIDRSASYTYDPNALNSLLQSRLFACVCVVATNVAQRRLALYESMLNENQVKIFPSVSAALLYCHELAGVDYDAEAQDSGR